MNMADVIKAIAFDPIWMAMTRTVVAGQNQFFTASGQPLKAARKSSLIVVFCRTNKRNRSSPSKLSTIFTLVMVRISDISRGWVGNAFEHEQELLDPFVSE